MARKHYLGKARTKARKDNDCRVYCYLKSLEYTPAKVPEQLNNYLMDYVDETMYWDGTSELIKRASRYVDELDI